MAKCKQLTPLPFNPFNASCSKLLLFERSSAILVRTERQSARTTKIENGGLDQYGKVGSAVKGLKR